MTRKTPITSTNDRWPAAMDFLATLGLDDFVPPALADWRSLLVEGLAFFLGRLPAARLAAILAGQLALPADAGGPRRLVAFLAQCPTLHKLGQLVARQRRLDPDLRRHLQTLESLPPSAPLAPILERVRTELPADAPIIMDREALAEGSVAVVVPFTYRIEGRLGEGVFKVLKPDVEARLAEELAVLDDLAEFLETRGRQLGLPAIDYRDYLMSVRQLLAQEVRFEVEQANLREAADIYADEFPIRVPRLLPWCTPRLTAMERVAGVKVTDAALSPGRRRALARTLFAGLLAKPFWTRSEKTVFHGDLHGGNILVADDGRLTVLDWALTAVLAKSQREALVAIAVAALALDGDAICRAVGRLGRPAADDRAMRAVVSRALDRLVMPGQPPGFQWLLNLLDELALEAGVSFPRNFALFRKTWLSLSGVIADLADDVSPDLPLLQAGLQQFVAEAPARWLAPPASHDFATHLSNVDLLRAWTSPWLAAARYWRRYWGLVR